MRVESIGLQNETISSNQEEAAKNIQGARVYGVTPDIYKENSEELGKELEKMSLAPVATPVAARKIASSPEHAALLSPDVEKLSYVERQIGFIGNKVSSKIGEEQQLIDLGWKKLNGNLTEEEDFERLSLKEFRKQNFGRKDYGITGTWESLPGDVAAEVANLGSLIGRNSQIIADVVKTTVVGGAALGAATGSVAPLVGTAAGAATGAVGGLGVGIIGGISVAGAFDAYKSMSASTYNELEDALDDNGKPLTIDEQNKRYLSHGVGIVGGGISLLSDKLMLKNVPFLNKLLSMPNVKELVTSASNTTLKQALIGIGKSIAINGTEEAAQEVVQIIAEEVGTTYNDGEVAFTNGLLRASQKLASDPKYQQRVGRAGLVGGVTGGTFATVGNAAGAAIAKVAAEPVKPKTDIVQTKTPEQQVVEVLEFQDVIDASKTVMETAKSKELSPEEISDFRRQVVEESGVTHVYLDKEEVATFANTPEKAALVRSIIDPTGQAAAAINAPFQIETHKFLDLLDQAPELSEYVRLNPEGPSPKAARIWHEKKKETDTKKAKLRDKLKVGEMPPEQRAYEVRITPEVDDATLAEALGSKEVADGYLARLDVNEVEVKETTLQFDAENPEGVQKLAEIATMRERVKALRDTLPDDVTAQQIVRSALEVEDPANDVFGEADYLNQPTMTEAIKSVLGDKEIDVIDQAQQAARQTVVDNINDTAKYEMNKVIDVVETQALEVQAEIEAQKIADDPNIAVVEEFMTYAGGFNKTPRFRKAIDLTGPHYKPGFSPYAIDPRTLTDEQKKKYLTNPKLRKRKVFVKGGVSPNDAAQLLGVNGGDNLLSLLERTPTRQEAISAGVELRRKSIREESERSVDLDRTSLAAAYHAKTANHIAEMKFLLSEKWSATKKGIKRVALPLPRIEVLTRKARQAVLQTKVGQLNANQFKVGERKSQRAAVTAVLKNDVEKAFINKEAAALNSELTIATHVAIGNVNKAIRFLRRFDAKQVQQELKDAGTLYVDAVNEILDVFNLDPARRNSSEAGAYQKWVAQQVEEGNGNFEIPDRLSDPRTSINDMTVEELLTVVNRLKSVLHQAKRKNELWQKYGDPAKQLQTQEALVARAHEIALANPDYKADRADTFTNPSPLQRMANHLNSAIAMIKNAETIVLQVDNDKVGGFFHELIIAPIKGTGKFKGQGEQGKITDMIALKKQFAKMIEKFGEKEWKLLENTDVFVPEFAQNKELQYGRLRKGQLLMMLVNSGNEGNIQRMTENFGTDIETIRQVLDRELDEKHAVIAQEIMDLHASYFPRVKKLHEDMTGVTPDFVEAVPFTHRGRVYKGGYYTLVYQSDMTVDAVRKKTDDTMAAAEGEKKFSLSDTFYTDDMTKHGHTEKRVGSDKKVNLDMSSIGMGFEMIIHDLNFRKPISDVMKIVTDDTISKDIAAIVGVQEYNVLINAIVDAAGSTQMENNRLYDSTKPLKMVESNVRSGLSAGVLVFNPATIGIQPTSMLYAIERMGPKGGIHIVETIQKMLENPTLVRDFQAFAAEINPSILNTIEGIDENQRDIISQMTPKNTSRILGEKGAQKVLEPLDAMREFLNNSGFRALGEVDAMMKVVVAISAYSEFLAGNAPGFDLDTVRKMTPEERDSKAKIYASSVSRVTLTAGSQFDRAEIQKSYKNIAMFFNDPRNILNNMLRQGRGIRHSISNKDIPKAARQIATTILVAATAKVFMDTVRGNATPFGSEDEETPDALTYVGSAYFETFFSTIPAVRDVTFLWNVSQENPNNRLVPGLYTKAVSDVVDAMMFMDSYIQGYETSTKEQKGAAFVASYLTGGIPVNALFKALDYIVEEAPGFTDTSVFTDSIGDLFSKRLETFKEEVAELPPEAQLSEEMMQALDQIELDIAPEKQEVVPEGTIEKIKEIESGGDPFAKNPNSSAAGLYQFTEGTWEDIMMRAPELGLTAGGRVSGNTSQQEKAMRWFTEQNARILAEEDIETTTENLYAAHFLGAKKAVEVLSADADTKMKLLISGEAMAANDFRSNMRVRDFKSWVSNKVARVDVEIAALDN